MRYKYYGGINLGVSAGHLKNPRVTKANTFTMGEAKEPKRGKNAFIVEAETISSFKSGDAAAFELIYSQFLPDLLDLAIEFLPDDRISAKNLVVSSFCLLYRKKQDFNTVQNIKAFLTVNVRDQSLKFFRHRKGTKDRTSYYIAPKDFELIPLTIQIKLFMYAAALLDR